MLQVHLCARSLRNIRLFQPDFRAVTAIAQEEPGLNPGGLVKVAAAITDFWAAYKFGALNGGLLIDSSVFHIKCPLFCLKE